MPTRQAARPDTAHGLGTAAHAERIGSDIRTCLYLYCVMAVPMLEALNAIQHGPIR